MKTKPSVVTALLIVLMFFGSIPQGFAAQEELQYDRTAFTADGFCDLEVVDCAYEVSIEEKIKAASIASGVNPDVAIRIAKCESSLNPNAHNKHSTATGLYQFTKGTWGFIGAEKKGLNRENVDDSIAMFVKWYPRHPEWWQCK